MWEIQKGTEQLSRCYVQGHPPDLPSREACLAARRAEWNISGSLFFLMSLVFRLDCIFWKDELVILKSKSLLYGRYSGWMCRSPTWPPVEGGTLDCEARDLEYFGKSHFINVVGISIRKHILKRSFIYTEKYKGSRVGDEEGDWSVEQVLCARSPTWPPVEGGKLGCEARDLEYFGKSHFFYVVGISIR